MENTSQNIFHLIDRIKDFGQLKTPDFIAYTLPLLEKVKYLHENNQVAMITHIQQIEYIDNRLSVSGPAKTIQYATRPLFVKPNQKSSIEVDQGYTEKLDVDTQSSEYSTNLIHMDENTSPSQASYLPNYKSWEYALGHYDPITDIFNLGMILASVAYQLDFREKDDLEAFVENRKRLFFLNQSLHPTAHNVIYEMTQVYREDRLSNLEEAITKLNNYREYNPENYVDLTETEGFRNQETSTRNQWILAKLKNRLFDISRRNKLLYFREQQNFLNLTISSVPLLLDHENIREKDLIFWNDNIRKKVIKSKKIIVNNFVEIGQNKIIAPTLNKIRLDARRSQNEYGFSQLRVVVAFLHWYNFKEDNTEKITSPLLLLPATVTKKKGVRDQFIIGFDSTEAEINPILSNYLKDLYDIDLPSFIDLETSDVEDLVNTIQQQIASDGSGISIEWRQKPKIKLIHTIAKKNFNLRTHKLTKKAAALNVRNFHYSYSNDDFIPLGLQIFKERIRYKNSALEYIINDSLSPTNNAVQEKARTFYTTDNEGDVNPLVWEVDTCNITIGNFNYRKMSLVRDYNEIIDSKTSDEIFDQLFSELPQRVLNDTESNSDLATNFPIISADPTQTKAIELARTGQSYIIQGPPGTGKSQTITNLIADYISRGKKILFVCEKRAALDVVFHRLKNRKLDELCCLIHDSQADKKSFILNLKETYESFISNTLDLNEIERNRKFVVDAIEAETEKLAFFHKQMKSGEVPPIELFEVLHRFNAHRVYPSETAIVQFALYSEWKSEREWITDWIEQLKTAGLEKAISQYPFAQLETSIIESSNPKQVVLDKIEKSVTILDNWLEQLDDFDIDDPEKMKLSLWKERFQLAERLGTIVNKGKLQVFSRGSNEAADLYEAKKSIQSLLQEKASLEKSNSNWKQKWGKDDAEQALIQWKKLNSSILRFVNPAFYKLKGQIAESYNLEAHKIKPDFEKLLTNLNDEYTCKDQIERLRTQTMSSFGLEAWDDETKWIEEMQLHPTKTLGHWVRENALEEINALNGQAAMFQELYENVEQLYGDVRNLKVENLDEKLQKSKPVVSSLSAMMPFIEKAKNVSPELKHCLYQMPWDLADFEFNFAYKSLKDIYETQANFARVEDDSLEISIRRINALLDKYYESNVEHIRAKIRDEFSDMIRVTESVAAQLTQEEKVQKKLWLAARRILENEFGKSMRYKSIRELAGEETNSLLTALKPVWLMSPLSVSDTMPIDVDLFDVVIYDEASQITVEEGVPSLFRTKQTIIVGDEMQMPPTNFFSSSNTVDEDESETEEHIGISLDADSLLNQGGRKLSSVMLGWHYRSRHESLISFSNAAFYKRGLLTIPDNVMHQSQSEESLPVTDISEDIDIDKMLSKSISYHYLENATYEKRKNVDEANYIAKMVQQLLNHKDGRSIGVVAFSMEQQSEIEAALQRLCTDDRDFEARLEQEYQRMDEDQFNGLFVKNLENVQGDERDIIIMSVCYGYNHSGKMYMNFGPINRRGGEKRLNVIFSRAKRNMVVVSSIQPQDIKNDYNEGANYFKRFLSYARLISEGRIGEANVILDSMSQTEELESLDNKLIVQQLKKELDKMGYAADVGVGQSHFKCDLAIKVDGEDRYQLGILIDHAHHYSNDDVLEQYCQRPEILKSFGWKITRVLYKDWFEQKERVLEKLKKILENKTVFEKAVNVDDLFEAGEDVDEEVHEAETKIYVVEDEKVEETEEVITEPSLDEVESKPSNEVTGDIPFERYEFVEGTSNKYWEIGVAESSVIVRYGRIGNKPQVSEKPFATNEKALEEKEKMIGKKVKKGYVFKSE